MSCLIEIIPSPEGEEEIEAIEFEAVLEKLQECIKNMSKEQREERSRKLKERFYPPK